MGTFQSLVLGVVQGLTEFLPVSSDGHLALAYKLMRLRPDLSFEVFLHAATLIAMIAYFRSDIVHFASALLPKHRERTDDRRMVLWIIIATAVSAVIALVLKPFLEPLAENMIAVALGFFGTSALLVLAEASSKGDGRVPDGSGLPAFAVVMVGIFQGLAALPGLSRSGSTTAGGMLFGLDREQAARFSFLLGIPIIALAAAKDGLDVIQGNGHLPGTPLALAVGFIAAGVSGYFAIWGTLAFVRKHRLYWFAAYTALLGAILLATTIL